MEYKGKGRPRGSLIGGCINDADYYTQWTEGGQRHTCPFFRAWSSMISRVYSVRLKEIHPTYEGTAMYEEWRLFSNFKSWMEGQVWNDGTQKLQLDKDILFVGNLEYSPTTCVFVPKYLNVLLNDCRGQRGKLPQGVSYQGPSRDAGPNRSSPFYSYVRSGGKTLRFGYYSTPMQAHAAWQEGKALEIEKAVDRHTQNVYHDRRVVDALLSRAARLRQDCAECTETVKL